MRTFFLCFAVLLPLAVIAQSSVSSQVPVLSPGTYVRGLSIGQYATRYVISIPETYSPAKPVPLVLALHFGGSPNGAAASVLTQLVKPALEELGAIIVAPESIFGQWDSTQNEQAVNLLLDGVLKNYNIDKKKIVVTGYSMGGAGTWYFAGKYPERFSAALPVSGRPPAAIANWRVPVFAVHSRDDEVVPIAPAEARIADLKKAGVRAEIVVLTGISHGQTSRFADGLRKAVPWLKETWGK